MQLVILDCLNCNITNFWFDEDTAYNVGSTRIYVDLRIIENTL